MNWLDWLMVAAVIVGVVIVIRFVQKITAIIATVLITLILLAFLLYFLSQWGPTAIVVTDLVQQSSLGTIFLNAGNWLFHTILGWGK